MKSTASPLRMDLILHALLFTIQIVLLFFSSGGLTQSGPTPPFVYPCVLILATVTIFRQNERLSEYGSQFIFWPSLIGSFLIVFCLINELGGSFWAFYTPRWFSVLTRIVWAQAALLLIHPSMYPLVRDGFTAGWEWLRQRGYFGRKLIVPFLIIGMVMWLLRSQNLSPDGYDWLKHSVFPKNWMRYLREPLGTFLFRLWVLFGMKVFDWSPYGCITLLNILCGLISIGFLWRIVWHFVPKPFAGFIFALVLASYGYTQVFVGNIEIYALLQLGLVLYLYCAVRYLRDEWPVWPLGLMFGILFCLHLSAGWWLPAFFLLPLFRSRNQGGVIFAVYEISVQSLVFFAVVLCFWGFILFYGYGGDPGLLWEHFWSDQVMLVGTDAAMFHPLDAYFDYNYYLTAFNEYSCLSIGALFLFCMILSSPRKWRGLDTEQGWLCVLAGFYLIYTIVWRPDRAYPADWDIFSGLTVPLILTLGAMTARLRYSIPVLQYTLYQSIVFSGLYLFLQVLRNHLKISEWPLAI